MYLRWQNINLDTIEGRKYYLDDFQRAEGVLSNLQLVGRWVLVCSALIENQMSKITILNINANAVK